MIPYPNFSQQPDFGADPSMTLPGNVNLMPLQMPKRGMFGGGKPDWGSAISAALNGYLAAGGNQAGALGLQQLHQKKLYEQQQAQAQQEYERSRADKRGDFVFEQDYRATHPAPPAPTEFDRAMQGAGIDPRSEQGRALYMQYVQNKANPFTAMTVQNPDGSETRQFMRPPMTPTAPVGKLIPIDDEGGPASQAPDGFR